MPLQAALSPLGTSDQGAVAVPVGQPLDFSFQFCDYSVDIEAEGLPSAPFQGETVSFTFLQTKDRGLGILHLCQNPLIGQWETGN